MKVSDRFTFTNFEKIVATVHSSLPHLPKNVIKSITVLLPYISLLLSAAYLFIAIFDPANLLDTSFIINNILLRATLVVIAGIFFMGFKPLSYKAQKGWDSLWYISIFHAFFGLIVFNIPLLLVPLFMWYFLFEIRKEYN